MNITIDHIVIGAHTLEQGVDYIQQQFGVKVPLGGVHPKMGTHNALMQLSDSLFFEIIAINPDSYTDETLIVDQPRWFSLDDPLLQKQLIQQPRLLTWVVNCSDINRALTQGIYRQTCAERITRGELSWDFALPADRSLLAAGLIPYILQWHGSHPAAKMKNLACQLQYITVHHPQPQWLTDQLRSIGIKDLVKIKSLPATQLAFMEAVFKTPKGLVSLSSCVSHTQ